MQKGQLATNNANMSKEAILSAESSVGRAFGRSDLCPEPHWKSFSAPPPC